MIYTRIKLTLIFTMIGSAAFPLTPHSLTCEYLQNPLCIDIAQPVLGWKMTSGDLTRAKDSYETLFGIVTESGHPADKAEGVRFLKKEKEFTVYEAGSGDYHFEVKK